MKILGIDLGKSRTGIAICDQKEIFAFPLKVINEKNEEKIVKKILNIIDENNIKKIVVGLPKNMNGSEGFSSDFTKKIVKNIKNKNKEIEIFMQDERYTTVLANKYLNNVNIKKNKRKKIVDAVAATIILQDFLQKLKNSKNL